MRSRIPGAVIVLPLAISLSACSALAATEGDAPFVAAQEAPWPGDGMPGFYMVSKEIQKFCPNGEEYLGGDQIADAVPPDEFDTLSGYACVFTAPASGRSDETDEIAYRIDSGLGDLVRAYANTVNYINGECPDPIEAIYPHVRIEYDNVGYTVLAGGCRDSPALDEALAGLRVTQVARDAVTFAEHEESGL